MTHADNTSAVHVNSTAVTRNSTGWNFPVPIECAVAVGFTQAVLAVLLNVFLVVVVLSSPALRRDIRNLLIVSIAAADLVVTGVLEPMRLLSWLGHRYTLNCYSRIVIQLLYTISDDFIRSWGVVCVDAVFLARLCRLDVALTSFFTSSLTTTAFGCRKLLNRVAVVVAVVLPWLLAVVLVVPISFSALRKHWSETNCFLHVAHTAWVSLISLYSFTPCVIVIVLLVVSACIMRRRRAAGIGSITPAMPPVVTAMSESDTAGAGRSDPLKAYVVASAVVFALEVPVVILNFMYVYIRFHRSSRYVMAWVHYTTIWLDGCTTFVMPLVWIFFLPDVRARAGDLCARGRRVMQGVKHATATEASVSYRNLEQT